MEIVSIDTQRENTDGTNDTYINLEYTINTVNTHITNRLSDTQEQITHKIYTNKLHIIIYTMRILHMQ